MGESGEGKGKRTACGEGPIYTLHRAAEYLHGVDSTPSLGAA